MRLAAFALGAALILPAAGVQAAGTIYKIRIVCKFDIEQYCKTIRAKRIRDIKECLAKHEKDLLPQCQDHYKDATP
jgi:hypothetical protein